jgi:hypothetical protein
MYCHDTFLYVIRQLAECRNDFDVIQSEGVLAGLIGAIGCIHQSFVLARHSDLLREKYRSGQSNVLKLVLKIFIKNLKAGQDWGYMSEYEGFRVRIRR